MKQESLSRLTAFGTGFTTEFERSILSNLGVELCAFANATGGVILFGMTDDGENVGIANHNKLKSQVQSTARFAEPMIAVETDSVGVVPCATVSQQYGEPCFSGGEFYICGSNNSQQMFCHEIRGFFYIERLIHLDETSCRDFDIDRDLMLEAWSQFAAQAHVLENMEPLVALGNLHLIASDKPLLTLESLANSNLLALRAEITLTVVQA